MKRFLATISYDGSETSGFQLQPGHNTIQSIVQKALLTFTKEAITIDGNGRTDAGVHALDYTFHFNVKTEFALKKLQTPSALHQINCILPASIKLLDFKPCPKNFHARMNAKLKTYVYIFGFGGKPNPFFLKHVWWLKKADVDIKLMRQELKSLIGTHNFKSFCASDSLVKEHTRTIVSAKITPLKNQFFKAKNESLYVLQITGTGFLKQMVRTIAGTLVEVGLKKRPAGSLEQIIASQDRKKAGRTAPAHGLYLKKVHYK